VYICQKIKDMDAVIIRKTKKRVILSIAQTTLTNMPMTRIMEWLRLEMLAQEVKFNEPALDTIEKEVSSNFWDSIKHRFEEQEMPVL
jgi:4-hydroxy-3-methylbut-2-enyl diphosphate reductase IspH